MNCKETYSAYLCDIPSKWRDQIVNLLCKAVKDISDAAVGDCEQFQSCETVTSLGVPSLDDEATLSIPYTDERGVTTTRQVSLAGILGDFIENQMSSAQSADFWISGSGTVGNLNVTSNSIPTNGLYLSGTNELSLSTDSTQRTILNSTSLTHMGTLNVDVNSGSSNLNVNNNSPSNSTFTVNIRQKSTASSNLGIMRIMNNAGTDVLILSGNGTMQLGNSNAMNLSGETNVGSIRVVPANNLINENVIRIHALGNITKTQSTLNLLTVGSSEGSTPTGRFLPTSGSGNMVTINVSPYIGQTGTASGHVYGVRYNPTIVGLLGKSIAFSNITGDNLLNETSGNTGIGFTVLDTLSARLHIAAGTATAGTAPIKLTAGTLLTTPETGAFEFDGSNLYFTVGGVRKTVTLT